MLPVGVFQLRVHETEPVGEKTDKQKLTNYGENAEKDDRRKNQMCELVILLLQKLLHVDKGARSLVRKRRVENVHVQCRHCGKRLTAGCCQAA